jgi:SEC-C motif-containing protein
MMEGMTPVDMTKACPCGRQLHKKPLPYGQCCGSWLETGALAPDAESLMRSRYSAFVLEREAYLLKTWHVSRRPATIEFEPGVKWLGLDVRTHTQDDAIHAQVEFVARQKPVQGAAVRLHERSRFVLVEGQWQYLDGDQL